MTDKARFLNKSFASPNLGQVGQNQAQTSFFSFHFLIFGSLVFLEIAYNESLQKCLSSSTGKIHKNTLGPKFGPEGKILPETNFFCHFLKFGSLLFHEIAYSDSLQQCLTFNRNKINFWGHIWAETGQNWA